MRIALVSHEYPPFGGGGIGTYATLMARCFADAGHEIHVITNRFDLGSSNPDHAKPEHQDGNLWVHRVHGWDDQFDPAGSHASHRCPIGTFAREFSPYLFYSEIVAEHLETLHRKYNFDIVEFPECAAEGFSALRRRRQRIGFSDLPMTVCCHSPIDEIYTYNYYPKDNLGYWRRKTMEDNSIRWADGIHAPSSLMLRIVNERLALPADSTPKDTLHLPIDFTEIPPPAALENNGSPPTLFFVGRLEPRKGVRYLIDAAVRLMQDGHPDLRVELVGRDCDAGEVPGSMTEYLKSRIPNNLKSNVIFHGYMQRELLFTRYRSASACVFAPEWDNFPYTCVEAMASGACIVGSDYCGVAEMVEHEKSGLLFRAGDVDSLEEAIRRAIEDPDLNARMRAHAIPRIHSLCNPDRAVEDRIEHYQRVIDKAHRHPFPMHPIQNGPGSVSVLLLADESATNDPMDSSIEKTLESIRVSSEYAQLDPCVRIVHAEGSVPGIGCSFDGVETVQSEKRGMSNARSDWQSSPAFFGSDYALCIRAGETITEGALAMWRRRIVVDDTIGWVSSYTLPEDGETPPAQLNQGPLDFELPFGLIDPGPLQIAFFRTSALISIGAWDCAMPEAWSDWALRIRFHEHGFRGEVVPLWLTRSVPRPNPDPIDENTRSVYLNRVRKLAPDAFEDHGSVLWCLDTFGDHHSFAADPRFVSN